ncbi:MAG TPA: hypothetical protein ENI11_06100, partial [Actinobacteria bacterium]|nr:hypothetical protein [Actinomycetota bacterium]
QVLTYHRAKGLEWPVVVLAGLNAGSRATAFSASVVAAPKFDPTDPLANRSIRFWLWPFGAQNNLPELDNRLIDREEEISARDRERTESRRLLYVGMTRARDGMVFAMRKSVTKGKTSLNTAWLNELTDEAGNPVLKLPLEAGGQELKVGDRSVLITTREFSAEDLGGLSLEDEEDVYLYPEVQDGKEYPPARFSPSKVEEKDGEFADVDVQVVADFGRQIKVKGKPDSAALGNAVHGFLGVDPSSLSVDRQLEIADRLLRAWGVEKSINPHDLLAISASLQAFIEENYPGAKVLREWPITLINAERQLGHGWIDMLLEVPAGYAVIDHKSYFGAGAQDDAKKDVAQLAIYKEAIEKATGKNVVATLIHMPMIGKILGFSNIWPS